ncbi:MFS transporter [Tumebacillus sp. DT12]|uniref:MFS transporter n=1 Tax=Tumebacillus lacus TaxID=2995335 RepID=A0ABT3X2S4_9BACL|nr:MFS transporter [Tumebacillus lacus]MCX7571209.1 MFS transporter [Tumebacillus lacus]
MQHPQVKTQENVTVYKILVAISLIHLLNDSLQAVIPAAFPVLQQSMSLTYAQIGLLSFTLSMTSSVLQPVVGLYTDKRPTPRLLALGMMMSMIGMIGIALAPSYLLVIFAIFFVGLGSAVFHPEGSRVAYMASGGRRGFAQSIYQVGGNAGSAMAPLLTALLFVPFGQFGAIWCTGLALLAIPVCLYVARWYQGQLDAGLFRAKPKKTVASGTAEAANRRKIGFAIVLLVFLVFARSWTSSGFHNYYQFYLIHDYGISITNAQAYVFTLAVAIVVGTLVGGPLGDRVGRRNVLLVSLLGALPVTLLLPHVSLFWAYPLLFLLGVVLASSSAATVVYAQELLPGKVGVASGLIVGLAFGLGGIGSVVLGNLADWYGLKFVMWFCSLLPLLGFLAFLLPSDRKLREMVE